MKKLVRLPEAELSVMRAVWRLPAPAPTGGPAPHKKNPGGRQKLPPPRLL